MSRPSWLASSPHADVLESLHQVAWADGVLSSGERIMLAALVARLGLTPRDQELEAWLSRRPEPLAGTPPIQGSFEQRFVISEAIRVAYEDGDYTPDEESWIRAWAQAWGIDPEEVALLEHEFLQERSTLDPFKI